MPSQNALRALEHLRDPSTFQWTAIPLLVLVTYIYSVEVERRNWNVLLAGLAFWGMDWFNEIWNALVFHFTGYAPVWGTPGPSAYQILIGLNAEISMMFAYMGIAAAKSLPRDKSLRVFGVPNRIVVACGFAAACVIVEMFLNAAGYLTWDYWWWSRRCPVLIFLFGYLHFFLVSFWVHDMERIESKVKAVAAIFGFDGACLLLFGPVLGWI